MVNKLKKMRKDKKGFTLVELIVVLVILAILAAFLVPALTKYIDKAKEKTIIAETRQIVMATQTLVDEKYATQDVGAAITVGETDGPTVVGYNKIAELSEVKGVNKDSLTDVDITDGKIKTLTWKNGKTCIYTAEPAAGKEIYEVQKAAQ